MSKSKRHTSDPTPTRPPIPKRIQAAILRLRSNSVALASIVDDLKIVWTWGLKTETRPDQIALTRHQLLVIDMLDSLLHEFDK